ncbi:MAG: histidine--tRNA ligase [Gammaproteobacteria bacterium]|nr:histidine--tRNA ligase [Gammaproteobacteria bacterium]
MIRAPKGTDDILPPVSRIWRRLLRAWDDLTERYGYDFTITPTFEATEVFSRGVGETNEMVEKQMYTFVDKGGRSLTLRPEGTASIMRAHLQAGGVGIRKAAYWGPMFRYERPQAGRRRQFYQLGVEYIGTASPLADAEVIELGYRYLVAAGVTEVEVAVSSIGDSACRPAYLERLRSYLREREDRLCADSRSRIASNPMRVLDCKVCKPVLGDAPAPVDDLCDDCRQHYDQVKKTLGALDIPYREDPHLVRGLDYYTRTAFEYIATGLDTAQNAVGGGGRYDGLAETLGGNSIPGVGLAMGLDRIVLASGRDKMDGELDVFIVVAHRPLEDDGVRLASELREQGYRVDFDPEGRSVKAQFKIASRRGAARVLVVGEEWERGVVTARDMKTGDQREVLIEEVSEWLS